MKESRGDPAVVAMGSSGFALEVGGSVGSDGDVV